MQFLSVLFVFSSVCLTACQATDEKASTYPDGDTDQFLTTETSTDTATETSTTVTETETDTQTDMDADGDGFSESEGDCDDSSALIYPGAEELCDGQWNDCELVESSTLPPEETDDDGDG